MEVLPHECLFEIFNNLRTYHKCLFSCLFVNRLWCRIIVPILWSEPGVHFRRKKLVKTCLLALNAKERALLIPFSLILPKNTNGLFNYTSYITSVEFNYLNEGVKNYYDKVDENQSNAVACSLALMFFRFSKGLKYLKFCGDIYNELLFTERLRKSTSVVSLTFTNCYLNDKVLYDILNKNITLVSLNLRYNKLGTETTKVLARIINANNTALTSLELYNNELDFEGVKALAKALCKNHTVAFLSLENNQLDFEAGKALAESLYINTTLTSLDLSFNLLCSEGGKALAEALCKNSTLAYLNLRCNRLGREAGKALADALYLNTTLASLDLSYNYLGSESNNLLCSEGGKALAEALCKNTTLTSLNLRCNRLGHEAVKALADALYINTTLASLDLSYNYLGSESKRALAKVLRNNTTLDSLKFIPSL